MFLVSVIVGLSRGDLSRLRREGFWMRKDHARQGAGRTDPPVGSTECPQ